MGEDRRLRRKLLRLYKKGRLKNETTKVYADNKGLEYPYKWEARLSSFCNLVEGCFKNGFPIVVPKLWYIAWAFYPFFFVRKNLHVKDPIPVLNHERIHIRQQRDIHITISLPLIIFCGLVELLEWFNPIYLLCCVPFIPTIVYGVELIRSWWKLYECSTLSLDETSHKLTFHKVRERTCFEQEAINKATDTNYLFNRKFWAVLSYK